MMKIYMITVDWSSDSFDPQALAQYIVDSRQFDGWWNYLPYIYMIATHHSSLQMKNILMPYMRETEFLVIEVKPQTATGLLKKAAWDWINTYAEPQLPLATNNLLNPPAKGGKK